MEKCTWYLWLARQQTAHPPTSSFLVWHHYGQAEKQTREKTKTREWETEEQGIDTPFDFVWSASHKAQLWLIIAELEPFFSSLTSVHLWRQHKEKTVWQIRPQTSLDSHFHPLDLSYVSSITQKMVHGASSKGFLPLWQVKPQSVCLNVVGADDNDVNSGCGCGIVVSSSGQSEVIRNYCMKEKQQLEDNFSSNVLSQPRSFISNLRSDTKVFIFIFILFCICSDLRGLIIWRQILKDVFWALSSPNYTVC